MNIEVGKKAPSFTLEGSDGKKHSLKDYYGKKLVIFFYPKDDTPGCTKEACRFRDLKSEFEDLDTAVLGVSPDGLESHAKFIEKFGLNFLLLADPSKKYMEKCGAWGEKNMYGKITTGVIRSSLVLDESGKVLKHWKRVPKAADHPDKVLAFLKEA